MEGNHTEAHASKTAVEQTESVKKEPNTNDDSEPEPDFLDELLQSADEIAAAVTETNQVKSEPNANINDDNEEIDPSFFDELLTRQNLNSLIPSSPPVQNQKRIKRERQDIEDGEISDDDDDAIIKPEPKSKKKKSKKSKRKKSKEKPVTVKKEKDTNNDKFSNAVAIESSRPRIQIRAEFRSFRTPSPPPQPSAEEEPTASPMENSPTTIETQIGRTSVYQPIPYQYAERHNDVTEQKPEKELSAEEKINRALERVANARQALQKAKLQKDKKFYPKDPVFEYASTVRKLPTSSSHFSQNIYDNRSPLHTVNNVTFQFNSMATRINLEEWGLESLPPKSKAIAKTLGCDFDTIFARKQSIKIPEKIQKSNKIQSTETASRELCEQNNSTLFMNVMVQTDPVKVIPNRRRGFYQDVGLQFTPSSNVIGTQTKSQGSDLPLFNVIRELNENQLEAVDDFVQFILEPVGTSGMDVYKQRKKLADIYKTSQIPVETSVSLKRTADDAGLSSIYQRRPNLPSPPALSSAYLQNDFIKREPNSYNPSPERLKLQNPPQIRDTNRYDGGHDDLPRPSVKFYGRGGMRR